MNASRGRLLSVPALAGAIAAALLPILAARAVNPDVEFVSYGCNWKGWVGATGNYFLGHGFGETTGPACEAFELDVAFRGSDFQWYWYHSELVVGGSGVAFQFCSDPYTGGGTCWWTDTVSGEHWASYSTFATTVYTWASCSGC